MRKIALEPTTELNIKGIDGFFKKTVTPFGTGAKIDCPKEFLGKEVYIIIAHDKS